MTTGAQRERGSGDPSRFAPSPGAAAVAGRREPVQVEPVRDRRDLRRFLTMPDALYRDDPHRVAPLLVERLDHLNPRKNPFFAQAEVAYWLARRGDRLVGRISAQIDRARLARHADATGHFGFLEAIDEPDVFAALLREAEDWLTRRGMSRVLGPFSLSINDECGLLIDGLDRPQHLMMGHARPYYAGRLEEQGYRKVKDLLAYRYDPRAPLPPAAAATLRRLHAEPSLRFRSLDMRRFEDEVRVVIDIFNDAWSANWGFVPFSEPELRYLARNLRLLLRSRHVAIAEIDGDPAAMAVVLPNLNEAIRDLDGRLLPYGWAKLLWRLKVRGVRSARVPLMGVRRRYQGSAFGMALAIGVIERIRQAHLARGIIEAELSWILEDNLPARRIIEGLGATIAKRYRIYGKELHGGGRG